MDQRIREEVHQNESISSDAVGIGEISKSRGMAGVSTTCAKAAGVSFRRRASSRRVRTLTSGLKRSRSKWVAQPGANVSDRYLSVMCRRELLELKATRMSSERTGLVGCTAEMVTMLILYVRMTRRPKLLILSFASRPLPSLGYSSIQVGVGFPRHREKMIC